jgi:hypothetical protein
VCGVLAARLRRRSRRLRVAAFQVLEVPLARQAPQLARQDGRRSESGTRLAGRFAQPDPADLPGATTGTIVIILNRSRVSGVVSYVLSGRAPLALVYVGSSPQRKGVVDSCRPARPEAGCGISLVPTNESRS